MDLMKHVDSLKERRKMKKTKIYPYSRFIKIPTKNVVSEALYEQTKWERDIALQQLEELGLGLGQIADGKYLSKEEYEKLLEYKYMYEDLCK